MKSQIHNWYGVSCLTQLPGFLPARGVGQGILSPDLVTFLNLIGDVLSRGAEGTQPKPTSSIP